jgi:hypothetical protein
MSKETPPQPPGFGTKAWSAVFLIASALLLPWRTQLSHQTLNIRHTPLLDNLPA